MSRGTREVSRSGPKRRDSWPTDARPLDDLDRPDPEAERCRRRRLRLWTGVLGAVFLAGAALAVFGERGALDVWRSQRRLHRMERDLREQVDRTRRLRLEVGRLQSEPSAAERLAREQLNLVRDGEILLLLPPAAESGQGRGPEQPER